MSGLDLTQFGDKHSRLSMASLEKDVPQFGLENSAYVVSSKVTRKLESLVTVQRVMPRGSKIGGWVV